MNNRKLQFTLNKIKKSKKNQHHLEALVLTYQLNLSLIKSNLESVLPNIALKNKKPKDVMDLLIHEHNINSSLKSILNKKSIKSIISWVKKMDVFFKALKVDMPKNTLALQKQGDYIFSILEASFKKRTTL
jgi:hypothetical protein